MNSTCGQRRVAVLAERCAAVEERASRARRRPPRAAATTTERASASRSGAAGCRAVTSEVRDRSGVFAAWATRLARQTSPSGTRRRRGSAVACRGARAAASGAAWRRSPRPRGVVGVGLLALGLLAAVGRRREGQQRGAALSRLEEQPCSTAGGRASRGRADLLDGARGVACGTRACPRAKRARPRAAVVARSLAGPRSMPRARGDRGAARK